MRVNYARRLLGAAICFGPVVLIVVSLIVAASRLNREFAGLGLAVGGFLIGLLNAYLSFARPQLYFWRHRSMDGYRFVSGVPAIGTLFVTMSGVWGFGELPTAAIGLIALALDTGGLPWFLIATWRARDLWDL